MGAVLVVAGHSNRARLEQSAAAMVGRCPWRGVFASRHRAGVLLGVQAWGEEASLGDFRGVTAAFHGYVGNWSSVFAEAGGSVPQGSDGERMAAAWALLGPVVVEHLRGEFAAAVVPASGELVLVRDALGCRSLFHSDVADELVVASDCRQVLAGARIPPRLNARKLADWLTQRAELEQETIYSKVLAVRAGHLLSFGVGVRPSTKGEYRCFWNPSGYAGSPRRSAGEFERVSGAREAALEAVREALTPDTVAVTVSGGLDSPTVLGAAREVQRRVPGLGGIVPVSAVFPGLRCDETELIRESTNRNGVEVDLSRPDISTMLRTELSATDGLPFPTFYVGQGLAAAANQAGARTLLTGHGGDEWFGAHDYGVSATARSRDLAGLLGRGRAIVETEGLTEALRRGFSAGLRSLGLESTWPPWLHRRFRRRPPPVGSSMSGLLERRLFLARASQSGWVFQNLEARGAWFQLDIRHPLFHRDIVEESLRDPEFHPPGSGAPKPLLRAAAAGLVPDSVRERGSKVFWEEDALLPVLRTLSRDLGPVRRWTLVQSGTLVAGAAERLVECPTPDEARKIHPVWLCLAEARARAIEEESLHSQERMRVD